MVYLFLADGFEECEALVPLDILRRGGIEVKTVGLGKESVTGAHGITVKSDISENEVILDLSLDCVILPGGMPGTDNLDNNKTVKNAVRFAYDNNKLVCAICAAPKILGGMGLLKELNATCFPGFESYLIGANLLNESVVTDRNIITAKGAGAAFQFSFAILKSLKDCKTAEDLALQMQYKTEV